MSFRKVFSDLFYFLKSKDVANLIKFLLIINGDEDMFVFFTRLPSRLPLKSAHP